MGSNALFNVAPPWKMNSTYFCPFGNNKLVLKNFMESSVVVLWIKLRKLSQKPLSFSECLIITNFSRKNQLSNTFFHKDFSISRHTASLPLPVSEEYATICLSGIAASISRSSLRIPRPQNLCGKSRRSNFSGLSYGCGGPPRECAWPYPVPLVYKRSARSSEDQYMLFCWRYSNSCTVL